MVNLVESIQKNLGYATLQKIDPNTQDIKDADKSFGTNSLAQAAIPAVLVGLFNYILQPAVDNAPLFSAGSKFIPLIFGNKEKEITKRVAEYAGASEANALGEMEHIASEGFRLIKESAGSDNPEALQQFSTEHKNDALLYLPAALQTGQLLGNNNLDDRTHKMEGPISSLMHSFEKQFSSDNRN